MNNFKLLSIIPNSFRLNIYSLVPFREYGLVDVLTECDGRKERLTLGFYRSSGTNSGKIKGKWYPICGVKMDDFEFTQFSKYQNSLFNKMHRKEFQSGGVEEGWLMKSIFFKLPSVDRGYGERGYSLTPIGDSLKRFAQELEELYESGNYHRRPKMEPSAYNSILMDERVYVGNSLSQIELHDIYLDSIVSHLLKK